MVWNWMTITGLILIWFGVCLLLGAVAVGYWKKKSEKDPR